MAPRTEQSKLETETIIRWDETGGPASLWTSSVKVRKEWESYGFKPQQAEHNGDHGWWAEVPVDRISYKTLQKR